jgi:hypothetical protein
MAHDPLTVAPLGADFVALVRKLVGLTRPCATAREAAARSRVA